MPNLEECLLNFRASLVDSCLHRWWTSVVCDVLTAGSRRWGWCRHQFTLWYYCQVNICCQVIVSNEYLYNVIYLCKLRNAEACVVSGQE